MGIAETIFGTSEETSPADEAAEQKYAILLSAGPDDAPVASNGFNYALELDDGGYEVQVFLDGEATKWPSTFSDDPGLPFAHDWEQLRQRGLLAGACGYCANAFEVASACERNGIDMLSDSTEHAPAIAELADEGYELLTIG